jgi:hypothetical protein
MTLQWSVTVGARLTTAGLARFLWHGAAALVLDIAQRWGTPRPAWEQHGPHLAESTDTHLGHAIAGRLARRLGGKLVAPAITLGSYEMNMSLAGTVSLRASTLEAVLFDVCESLVAARVSRHHFSQRPRQQLPSPP